MNPEPRPELSKDFSKASTAPLAFIEYRKRSSEEINKLIDKYQEGNLSDAAIEAHFAADPQTRDIIKFVMDAFKGEKRKSGGHLSSHSLQLAETARKFGVTDKDVLQTALLHDVIEDTPHTKEEIAEKFGEKLATFADLMTEKRNLEDRDLSVVAFVEQLRSGGYVTAAAETVDRLDDISDIGYLTKKLQDPALSTEKHASVKQEIAKKFGKCRFTLDQLLPSFRDRLEIKQLEQIFNSVLDAQAAEYHIPSDTIQAEYDNYVNKKSQYLAGN